jgi:gamma-glutamyl:cysteine ligase YbdK (ATP-grasp superfamily)
MLDAEELGCATHIARCRAIVGAGTSADAQIAVFRAHEKTESRERALDAVNDWLVAATLQ